jgi:NRPS condensation-like uncharacterized protein
MNEFKEQSTTKKIPKRFPTSALDKLTYCLQETSDQLIHLIIHYNGTLDFELLKQAIKISLNLEPVLGCKFVEHPKQPYFERRNDLDKVKYCSLIKTTNLQKELHNFVLQEIDSTTDPLFFLAVFREKNDILCLKVNHVLMDGAAILEFLSLITKIYSCLEKKTPITIKPNFNPQRTLQPVFKRIGLLKRLILLFKTKAPKSSWSFPWHDTARTNKNFIVHRFTRDRFRKIKAYSKVNNATINDLLITAFIRALLTIVTRKPTDRLVSVTTVNLRAYLPGKKADSLCNLSTGAYPTIPYFSDKSFAEMLALVVKKTNKIKQNYPGLGPALALKQLFRFKFSKAKKLVQQGIQKDLETKETHPILTNVGLIPDQALDFGLLEAEDAYLITPIVFAPGFIMGVITFKEKMTCSIGFCEGSYRKELVEQFIQEFDNELPG